MRRIWIGIWMAGLSLAAGATMTHLAHGDEKAGTRILVVGDSHTAGTFGRKLDVALRSIPGAQVSVYGICGASPSNYYSGQGTHCGTLQHPADGPAKWPRDSRTPLLATLLSQARPTLTVVALGTNQLRGTATAARESVTRMIRDVSARGSACVWVGPPDERFVPRKVQESFYRMLTEVTQAERCELIDSRKLTEYPAQGGDGIHYDGLGAAGVEQASHWAAQVTARVSRLVSPGHP